ncbi:MAG TPA: hypothetical protein VF735_01665 [Pyrinomonadaceae bacterium]
MKRLKMICLLTLLFVGASVRLSAQVRSPELSDIGDEVERSVKEKMPKWKRNPAIPIANDEASVPISERESVLIDQWISDDAVVKVTILKHSSAAEAAGELQKFISGVNGKGRLHNMGDEAYSWGIRGSIAFRRGRLTIYISAVAGNVTDEAALSREFARHVAATLSRF